MTPLSKSHSEETPASRPMEGDEATEKKAQQEVAVTPTKHVEAATHSKSSPKKKQLSPSEELRTQICSNQFCQCIRRDGQIMRVQDLIRARLLKHQKRIEQEQLEREARDFLASLDNGAGGGTTTTSTSNNSRNKKTKDAQPTKAITAPQPRRLTPPPPSPHGGTNPALQQQQQAAQHLMHAQMAQARALQAAATARQQQQLMAAAHPQQRRTSYHHQQQQQQEGGGRRKSQGPSLSAHSVLTPQVWQAHGSFSRKTRRVETAWDYRAGPPAAKRPKTDYHPNAHAAGSLPAWVMATAMPPGADRRTSESDMTATSELTQQSLTAGAGATDHHQNHVVGVGSGGQGNVTATTLPGDDDHTHVVSLTSQQQPPQPRWMPGARSSLVH